MPVNCDCPRCANPLHIPDKQLGLRRVCPHCRFAFMIEPSTLRLVQIALPIKPQTTPVPHASPQNPASRRPSSAPTPRPQPRTAPIRIGHDELSPVALTPTEIIPAPQPRHPGPSHPPQPQPYGSPHPSNNPPYNPPQPQHQPPIYSSPLITIYPDLRIDYHGNYPEDAKAAVRELRQLKGEIQRESARLALDMREHRASHTRAVRNTIPHVPFYGKIGRTIRFGQTVFAFLGRVELAANLQPYEQRKLVLDRLAIEIRGAIDEIGHLYD